VANSTTSALLNGIPVVDVIDEEDGRVAHLLAAPLTAETVQGQIDWSRRFDFMQQHSGQHLLSAVIPQPTVSVHLGLELSTIDVEADKLDLAAIEDRANAAVFSNLPLSVTYEDAATAHRPSQSHRPHRHHPHRHHRRP
jgi:alanyl-tRNA synthetase